MRLTRAALEGVDLERLRPFVEGPNSAAFFDRREHYRLLALLSTLVLPGKTIVDIGTCYGDSALALSYGGRFVQSFDIEDRVGDRSFPGNIRRNIADLFDPTTRESFHDTLLDSGLILIDIAPHAGKQEYELVRWLQENDYRGLIVLDDVWWYKEMRDNLWYRIEPWFRVDATSMGHWSGTGIVSFDPDDEVEIEGVSAVRSWTLVTGYFDLTKLPDASTEIRSRSPEWYLDVHGTSVLSLDKDLVIFCDPEFEERIWQARPSFLHHRTRVVPMSFEDFPLTKYRSRIIENRGGALTCPSDPRDTASYYLFCMARYAMVKQAIDFNPFNSTHFCWIDLGIERMGFNNLIHLDEALGVYRNRFSTCFIDYVPRGLVEDLPAYFGGSACWGRCSMASGFFSGRADYMQRFCNEIEVEFLTCLAAGFGHADEQLYPRIYFRRPELFDWYIGDYTEVITNYTGVYEKPESPIRNLIRNSLAAGDKEVCFRACEILLDSYASGKCGLSGDQFDELNRTLKACQ